MALLEIEAEDRAAARAEWEERLEAIRNTPPKVRALETALASQEAEERAAS